MTLRFKVANHITRQWIMRCCEPGDSRTGVIGAISKSDGSLIHRQKHRLERYTKHFRMQFRWPIDTVNSLFSPVIEIMQVGTCLLSELKVFLKDKSAATRWVVAIVFQTYW